VHIKKSSTGPDEELGSRKKPTHVRKRRPEGGSREKKTEPKGLLSIGGQKPGKVLWDTATKESPGKQSETRKDLGDKEKIMKQGRSGGGWEKRVLT